MPDKLDILRHMLGAGDHIRKSQHGYRNHYCASIGSSEYITLLKMRDDGLVTAGRLSASTNQQFFYATKLGCVSIGLHKAAIDRALFNG